MLLTSITTSCGKPQPLGPSYAEDLKNFSLFCPDAEAVSLLLLLPKEKDHLEYPLDRQKNKTDDCWHIALKGLPETTLYSYLITPKNNNSSYRLIDPYARSLNTHNKWGQHPFQNDVWGVILNQKFDWKDAQKPLINLEDLVIYEMHVRGFTQSPSSKVKSPGGFLGIVEKLDSLKELGINAIELLPVFEFNENETSVFQNPLQRDLCNYWGYSTLHFFSPMNRFASNSNLGTSIEEFKTLVKEAHHRGIEIILDVVFNHTGEHFLRPPLFSFKGLSKDSYYMNHNGEDVNYSGCGNTFNPNDPICKNFIIDVLHYWSQEMQVDGFRFDLGAILARDSKGTPLKSPPLIESLENDLLLKNTKLIMEPWDAAGLHLLDSFPNRQRFSYWNDQFRDTTRKFIKGSPEIKKHFASCFSGSEFLFHELKSPLHSLNYITCHDGMSLQDLISYNNKHNEGNGEQGRDGSNHEESWNCGQEGASSNPNILRLRQRQTKNFFVALLCSQGVPMISMGDEYGHTKYGNNNSWSHDNDLNWFQWNLHKKQAPLRGFLKNLLLLRRDFPCLHQKQFLTPQTTKWHSEQAFTPNWDSPSLYLGVSIEDIEQGTALYLGFNPSHLSITIELPEIFKGNKWVKLVDTALASPEDIDYPNDKIGNYTYYTLSSYSVIIFLSSS
jgi:isoamylase